MNILGTCYFVVLNSTLGARWVHDSSMHLIFPALNFSAINLPSVFISHLRLFLDIKIVMCQKFFVLLIGPDIAKIAEGNTLQKIICGLGVAEHGRTFSMYHRKAHFLN